VAKNEDGEFELILGNRQLLSVFFIVVILLGVFFTMGYIVGRNSTPLGGTEIASSRKGETKPLVVESPAHDAASLPAASPSSAPPSATAPQVAETPKASEPPPRPEPSRAETAKAKASESKPEAKPREPEKPAAAAPSSSGAQPATGETYLQLAATSQREADILVDVLRKKGFKSRSAEIPEKAGTYRVLVGPLDPADINRMRADLQGAGFPGNVAIRRTF
jgi:cell division septation protein DedD